MSLIFREYGNFMLSSLAVIGVMFLLFARIEDEEGNVGVCNIVRTQIEIENVDYVGYTDFKTTYQSESYKEAPQISYYGGALCIGEVYLNECVKAIDYAGRNLEICVRSIINPIGKEIIDEYDRISSRINTNVAGIYTITVSALDDSNRFTQAVIRIPINK